MRNLFAFFILKIESLCVQGGLSMGSRGHCAILFILFGNSIWLKKNSYLFFYQFDLEYKVQIAIVT